MDKPLRSCPFCGGEAEYYKRYIGYGSSGLGAHDWFTVSCKKCRVKSYEYGTEEEAIAAWNRRAQQENKPLTVEQLRERAERCKPIYIARIGDDTPIFRGNKVVGGVLDTAAVMNVATHLPVLAIYGRNLSLAESDYGKTWLAYAQAPERSE